MGTPASLETSIFADKPMNFPPINQHPMISPDAPVDLLELGVTGLYGDLYINEFPGKKNTAQNLCLRAICHSLTSLWVINTAEKEEEKIKKEAELMARALIRVGKDIEEQNLNMILEWIDRLLLLSTTKIKFCISSTVIRVLSEMNYDKGSSQPAKKKAKKKMSVVFV